MNVTLEDNFGMDFHFPISPPKLSSYLLIYVISVYKNSKRQEDNGYVYYTDSFGFSKLRMNGMFELGTKYIKHQDTYSAVKDNVS